MGKSTNTVSNSITLQLFYIKVLNECKFQHKECWQSQGVIKYLHHNKDYSEFYSSNKTEIYYNINGPISKFVSHVPTHSLLSKEE